MTRWMRPPEIEQQGGRTRIDPLVEGAQYRLSDDLLLRIWERTCADATDGSGRCDLEQARRRFHEIAARLAACGGRLRPDVGRRTQVEDQIDRDLGDTWRADELMPRVPGRETLVAVEARRWSQLRGERVAVLETTGDAEISERDDRILDPYKERVPREVVLAMVELRLRAQPPAWPLDDLVPRALQRWLDIHPDRTRRGRPGRRADPRSERRLPPEMLARMEQVYRRPFDDVEIHPDSAEVPAGAQAFTRGRHIHLEPGAVDLDSEHGEHVVAHELAHVVQQSQPAGGSRPASRAALEVDAHEAALNALAGRTATVNLFAPASAALGFSNGKPAQHPSAPAGPAQPRSARSSGPVPVPSSPLATRGSSGSGQGASASRASGGRNGASGSPPPGAAPVNGATPPSAAAPRRGAGADRLLVPEAPAALTPAAAGRLQTIRAGNQGVAAATTTLPTAEQQTDVARAAVVEPQSEQDAHAQHGVVAAVDDRPPPSPEIETACARIRQVIRDKRPPDEDKLVEAKPKEMAQAAGEEMSAGVEQRAGSVRQGYADMQQKPEGTPSTTPVPATLPPERAQTPAVDATAGAPDPLKHDDVSLDGDVAAQQQQIQDAGMNTEAGQLVKDGPIGDARGGAGDLETMAKTDPQKVLADQAAAIAHAKGDMQKLQAAAEKALAEARAGTVAHIGQHTTGVKGSEEQQRAEAGAKMQAIFTGAQKTVDQLLQPLSGSAVARWEAGVARLSTDFENSLASVKQKIEERHSGVLGGLTELGDSVFGLPPWVTLEYDLAEKKFGDGATELITDISRDVNKVIEDCKKLIDQARKDIEAVVHSLPASLQSWAQGEATRLGKQLDQLSAKVDQAQHGLNQDLINRANGAVQTVRERVADLREQAKGLIGKIADAIAEFVKNPAKAIINGLLHILGIPPASFWALIDKLGDVISGIAAEPKKFANTLMAGVGQGFQQFFHNLPMHLGQALFQWLFGKLGEAGVSMPTDFSIKSILTLVLEVMGITWTRIKTILAKHIGEQNAEILDQAVQLIQVLIEKGPQGVFELIKEQLDPSMILDAIKDAAIQYVMQAIITRVTARILMMLNPAGAILQAIEAIYRVIKWVIDNAARIFTLIESIVNGAAQILAGNVSGVANLVETSLVRLMVPVIDFLADYLGLGGIPNAIKNVILGLQKRVEAILDKVIGFLVTKAKALWEALKSRGKGKDKGDDKDKDDKDKDQDADAHGFDPIETHGTMQGTPHTLTVRPDGHIILASHPEEAASKVSKALGQMEGHPSATEKEAADELEAINQMIQEIKVAVDKIPVGSKDGRALGPKESTTKAANLSPLARRLMALSERIMTAVNRYGAKFKVHELDESLADRYPTPVVGLHTLSVSETLPDGLGRESHHVPNAKLFETLVDELAAAGTKLSSNSPEHSLGFNKKGGFLKLGEDMTSKAKQLRDDHPAGEHLAAILIHRLTHQNVNKQTGTAVHSPGMTRLIEQMIKNEESIAGEYQRVMTQGGRLAVRPNDKGWKPYVDQCRRAVEEAQTPEDRQRAQQDLDLVKSVENELRIVSQHEREALERIANREITPVLRTAFEGAFTQMYAAVEGALRLSRVDGKDGEKTAVLGKLHGVSQASWKPLIEVRFAIPSTELELSNASAPLHEQHHEPRTEVGQTVSFQSGSEAHQHWIDVQNGNATPMVSSTKMTVQECLDKMAGRLARMDPALQPHPGGRNLADMIERARRALRTTHTLASAALAPQATGDHEVRGAQMSLGDLLRALFEIFPEHDERVGNVTDQSMASNPDFEADAKVFEAKLGAYAWRHSASNTALGKMATQAAVYLWYKAGKVWDEESPVLKVLFEGIPGQPKTGIGSDDAASSGSVGKVVQDVMAVFSEGNMTERFPHLVRFYTDILADDLANVAQEKEVRQRLKAVGMKVTYLQQLMDERQSKEGKPTTREMAPVPKSSFDSEGQDSSPVNQQGDARIERGDLVAGASYQTTRTAADMGITLSPRERALQQQADSTWDEARDALLWLEGSRKWVINERNAWVIQQRKLSVPLGGGPSGTTNTMMCMARAFDAERHAVRLACIGYMIPAGHHTLVEILAAAKPHGCDYTPGKDMYRYIRPLEEPELRAIGNGKLPGDPKADPPAPVKP